MGCSVGLGLQVKGQSLQPGFLFKPAQQRKEEMALISRKGRGWGSRKVLERISKPTNHQKHEHQQRPEKKPWDRVEQTSLSAVGGSKFSSAKNNSFINFSLQLGLGFPPNKYGCPCRAAKSPLELIAGPDFISLPRALWDSMQQSSDIPN